MKHLIFAIALIFFATQANAETAGIIGTWPCGADCTATLDSEGNMKITGSGEMSHFNPHCFGTPMVCTSDSPWLKYKSQIKSVDIQGVSNVGEGAFYTIPIEKLTLGNTVTDVKWDAFEGHHIRTLELPDSVTTIGAQAFAGGYLQNLLIPDSVTLIQMSAFGRDEAKNLNITCKGSNCNRVKALFENYYYASHDEFLTKDFSSHFSLAGENQCNSEKYYWTGGMCNNRPTDGSMIECDEGWYATNKDVCARIKLRYTLPEADEATSDDYENMIEWIFE
ncbi:MAG: leucine-rich repeat protein [Alphaproteobacteria bacterium]|nr:leucine-rich repeat protein [Alphaproteobacteria bacterium]